MVRLFERVKEVFKLQFAIKVRKHLKFLKVLRKKKEAVKKNAMKIKQKSLQRLC